MRASMLQEALSEVLNVEIYEVECTYRWNLIPRDMPP